MSVIVVVLQLIFLEGILSLDNAAVLGAMVAPLSDQDGVPWPRWLVGIGPALNRMLGPQRTAALKVGLLGAYLGRGLMLVLAAWVVRNPWLKLLGALYLIKLAAENLGQRSETLDQPVVVNQSGDFWRVVLAVELADLAFSLDNVVAAVALSDHLLVILAGVAIGILMMRFAAQVFSRLVIREPILEPAAYVLILLIGLDLLVEELVGFSVGDGGRFLLSVVALVLAILYAHWQPMRRVKNILRLAGWCLWGVDRVFSWVVRPVSVLFSKIVIVMSPRSADV